VHDIKIFIRDSWILNGSEAKFFDMTHLIFDGIECKWGFPPLRSIWVRRGPWAFRASPIHPGRRCHRRPPYYHIRPCGPCPVRSTSHQIRWRAASIAAPVACWSAEKIIAHFILLYFHFPPWELYGIIYNMRRMLILLHSAKGDYWSIFSRQHLNSIWKMSVCGVIYFCF